MKPKWDSLDKFTRAYITCALWSSNDESTPQGGEPLDKNYDYNDISDETAAWMIADCKQFQEQNMEMIAAEFSHAGHDFWLTRCGHGAGFWDGDWPEPAGTNLTEASKRYGECNLYVGDDKMIYHM